MDLDFTELPDLAAAAVGGAAILCNDEFFAEKENLLRAHAAEWREGAYTDRGKWMDGWETRRRREPGHDWCVIRLGMPGRIRGVVVDTAFFRGNFPASCSLEAAEITDALDLAALETAHWQEIVPRSPLAGDTKNAFAIAESVAARRFTHVRLRIYPDGGVARLRVHGEVVPDLSRLRASGLFDLAALEHGAWVETCSDMFFGSRQNLIKPGPSLSMADGWETKRRRGPGNDWAIVRLAANGVIERVEVDTTHFKGNAPGRCVLEGARSPSEGWHVLLETPLQPHTRHVFDGALRRVGAVGYVRLSVFPDGGVARLRVWGRLEPEEDRGLSRLNAMTNEEATAALRRCCGSARWASVLASARPFEDRTALARIAERTWWSLGEADWLEAFAAHARIGERDGTSAPEARRGPHQNFPAAGDAAWSEGEQRAAAGAAAATTTELAALGKEYEARFGFMFIVCASGRSAESMLEELRRRVVGTREAELRTAAEEQAGITRLRLTKLVEELS
jgi:allantoicase